MATRTYVCAFLRSSLRSQPSPVLRLAGQRRWQSQLKENKCNPYIYAIEDQKSSSGHVLTLLSTTPANADLALGRTSELPPTTESFEDNPQFMPILQSVIKEHAGQDPVVISDAQAYVSTEKSAMGMGGAGGGDVGGYVHIWDSRSPPDFGRIPDPENIFGSVEVDSKGNLVDGHGNYQESGTYRVLTPDGILGLSDHLREKLVERLHKEAAKKS